MIGSNAPASRLKNESEWIRMTSSKNQSMNARFNRLAIAIGAIGMVGVGMLAGLSNTAYAAPEPSPVATQWEFTFENGPLRLAWVDDGDGVNPYYYFTYSVTNHWGGVKLFAPDVQLMSDNAHVLRSGRDVSSSVTEEIMDRLDNPLLESQIDIVSNVLEGIEHARDGVVIWPASDLEADEVTVFFAGLSGEFQSYIVGRESNDPHRYTLRKTLMLRYSTPGELDQQGDTPFELAEKRWVMR